MFDVSFSEILVIAVVALVVIGPERLPKVARTLGLLTGRVQRYVATVKADIERELRLDELRKMEGEARQSILSSQQQIQSDAAEVKDTLQSVADQTRRP